MGRKKSHAALRTEFRNLLRNNEEAIIKKLMANERKYNFGMGWKVPNWREKLQADVVHHTAKGDARDVVILGNFAMYHGWSTASPTAWVPTAHSYPTPPVGDTREYWVALPDGTVGELWYAYKFEMDENFEEEGTYTGWMSDRNSHGEPHPEDGGLWAYVGPKPTHWREKEPTPTAPVDAATANTRPEPKYSVGDVVYVDMRSETPPYNFIGYHAARIVKRIWGGEGYGWFYKPEFLYKNGADAIEFMMGFDYAEARVRALTDDERDAYAMSAHALAPVGVPRPNTLGRPDYL